MHQFRATDTGNDEDRKLTCNNDAASETRQQIKSVMQPKTKPQIADASMEMDSDMANDGAHPLEHENDTGDGNNQIELDLSGVCVCVCCG